MGLIAFICLVLLCSLIAVLHYTKGLSIALELILDRLIPGEIAKIIKSVLLTLITISTLFFGFLTFKPADNDQAEELVKKLEAMLDNQEKLEKQIATLQEETKQSKNKAIQEFSKPKLDRDFLEESLNRYELLIERKITLEENAQKINQAISSLDDNEKFRNLAPAAQQAAQQIQQSLKLSLKRVDNQLEAVQTELAAFRKVLISEASR